jgi:hypothetical protein
MTEKEKSIDSVLMYLWMQVPGEKEEERNAQRDSILFHRFFLSLSFFSFFALVFSVVRPLVLTFKSGADVLCEMRE